MTASTAIAAVFAPHPDDLSFDENGTVFAKKDNRDDAETGTLAMLGEGAKNYYVTPNGVNIRV